MAVGCQIVVIAAALTAAIVGFAPAALWLIGIWGVAQWALLIPLILLQVKRGNSLKVKGILIAGCIGFMLNAGCDALIWGPR